MMDWFDNDSLYVESDDLRDVIKKVNLAVAQAKGRQPDYAEALNSLAGAYWFCYIASQQPIHLLVSIRVAEEAASSLIDKDDPECALIHLSTWSKLLSNLGSSLYYLYKLTSEPAVVDFAVSAAQIAITANVDRGPPEGIYWHNLGSMLETRYLQTGRESDLAQSVGAARHAANSLPLGDPFYAQPLMALGCRLNLWHDLKHLPGLLDEAICTFRRAAQFANGLSLVTSLTNLSILLSKRYELAGTVSDMEDSVRVARSASRAHFNGEYPEDGPVLRCLANQLHALYGATGQRKYLEESIDVMRTALESIEENDPDFPTALDELAQMLHEKYDRTNTLAYIEEAVELSRTAVRMSTGTVDDQCMFMGNLGNHLALRAEHTGDISNLMESIRLARDALKHSPADSVRNGSLANKLEQLYGQSGDVKYLKEAIRVNQKAVELAVLGFSDRAGRLNDLGNQFDILYERTGELGDLREAIHCAQKAVELTPEWHPSRAAMLSNLSIKLSSLYLREGLVSMQDDAINAARLAVDLTPPDHQDRAIYSNTLGSHYHQLFGRTRNLEHLEEAIKLWRKAIEMTPQTHTSCTVYWHNLGTALADLYKMSAQERYLEEAMEYVTLAVNSTPVGHPVRSGRLISLARLIETRYKLLKDLADQDLILKYVLEAWNCTSAAPLDRVTAGAWALRLLASAGTADRDRQGIKLGTAVLALLPMIHTRSLDREDQQFVLSSFSGVAPTLASLHLKIGQLSEAVQHLEHGRTVIINQLLDDRADVSALHRNHPELADQFRNLVQQLNIVSNRARNMELAKLVAGRRETVDKLDVCLKKIRSKPLHERFLLGLTVDEIQKHASQGYIVLVNVTEFGRDAIIISSRNLVRVELPAHLSRDAPIWLAKNWKIGGWLQQRPKNDGYLEYLRWLWDACVKPILDEVTTGSEQETGHLPRVWWIGSGLASSMPFHAAGIHAEKSTENTYSKAISSYTPSVRALAHARKRSEQSRLRGDGRDPVLIVTMPTTPNGTPYSSHMHPLPGTKEEKSRVLNSIRGHMSPTILEHPSVEDVAGALETCSIAHFACHGVTDRHNPSKAGLVLQRRGHCRNEVIRDLLTVQRVSQLALERSQIAYLSACSTAENRAPGLLDESIHLASGFLVAGFPYVLACLWSTGDSECLEVAGQFYSVLFEQGASGLGDNVAAAFQKAVQKVRLAQLRTPLNWAQFVHYGA